MKNNSQKTSITRSTRKSVVHRAVDRASLSINSHRHISSRQAVVMAMGVAGITLAVEIIMCSAWSSKSLVRSRLPRLGRRTSHWLWRVRWERLLSATPRHPVHFSTSSVPTRRLRIEVGRRPSTPLLKPGKLSGRISRICIPFYYKWRHMNENSRRRQAKRARRKSSRSTCNGGPRCRVSTKSYGRPRK